MWFATPGRSHIHRDTVVPHARAWKPGFALRVTVIRPNPFIGYQSQGERGLSRDTPLLYILWFFFRTMSDNVAKQIKGFERKPPSRRRQLCLARAVIVRHKSGISLSSPGLTTSDSLRRDAKIKSKQRRRTTVRSHCVCLLF